MAIGLVSLQEMFLRPDKIKAIGGKHYPHVFVSKITCREFGRFYGKFNYASRKESPAAHKYSLFSNISCSQIFAVFK